jgi:hypothetical protein
MDTTTTILPEADDTSNDTLQTREIHVLSCGGSGCCPMIERTEGGVRFHDTDDGRDYHREMSDEQAESLCKWLMSQGYGA